MVAVGFFRPGRRGGGNRGLGGFDGPGRGGREDRRIRFRAGASWSDRRGGSPCGHGAAQDCWKEKNRVSSRFFHHFLLLWEGNRISPPFHNQLGFLYILTAGPAPDPWSTRLPTGPDRRRCILLGADNGRSPHGGFPRNPLRAGRTVNPHPCGRR
jgi:hypothetical protein